MKCCPGSRNVGTPPSCTVMNYSTYGTRTALRLSSCGARLSSFSRGKERVTSKCPRFRSFSNLRRSLANPFVSFLSVGDCVCCREALRGGSFSAYPALVELFIVGRTRHAHSTLSGFAISSLRVKHRLAAEVCNFPPSVLVVLGSVASGARVWPHLRTEAAQTF